VIFRPRLANLVVAGKKTQTRRAVKDGERDCRYRPGREYAVQPGRGKPARGRIAILAVKSQRLADITFDEARAEGFRSRDEFFDYWRELHGDVDQDLVVWAIAFRLVDDPPRLLHRDSSHGYTTDTRQALEEEQEAISEEEQRELTREAHERDRKRWETDKSELLEAIEKAKDNPAVRRFSHMLSQMEQRVERIDRNLKQAA
jgi:hypothetical protein